MNKNIHDRVSKLLITRGLLGTYQPCREMHCLSYSCRWWSLYITAENVLRNESKQLQGYQLTDTKSHGYEFAIVKNSNLKHKAPYTLSVKMNDFTVWRQTWRKTEQNMQFWQNSELFFPVAFHTQNCAVHSGNPTVLSVYLPTPRWHHLKALNRTDKKLTNLMGNLFCARKHLVQFFMLSFYTLNSSV
jgi:hypothetical protein